MKPILTLPSSTDHALALGERCDEGIDLLLIRTLAPCVDARTCGVTDPQHDLLRSRRVMDQHRGRIEGIEIPTLVEGPIDQIDGRARRAHLGVAWNDDATAFDRATHRHPESWMDHCGAVLEVAANADQRRLGVGAQLCWARAQHRQRRFGERGPKLERIVDQRFQVGAGRLAGERVLKYRGHRDASQRRSGARAVLAVDLLDESDGLANGHDVLPRDVRSELATTNHCDGHVQSRRRECKVIVIARHAVPKQSRATDAAPGLLRPLAPRNDAWARAFGALPTLPPAFSARGRRWCRRFRSSAARASWP